MSAYVDGELTGNEMLAIRRHINLCGDCQAEYQSVMAVKKAVANLATARPKPNLLADILSRLDVVTVPKHQRFADWLIRTMQQRVSPVAAALAISGLALIMLSAGGLENVTSPTSSNAAGPVQQVSFFRESDSFSLSLGQPVRLAEDIPGVGRSNVRFVNYTVR